MFARHQLYGDSQGLWEEFTHDFLATSSFYLLLSSPSLPGVTSMNSYFNLANSVISARATLPEPDLETKYSLASLSSMGSSLWMLSCWSSNTCTSNYMQIYAKEYNSVPCRRPPWVVRFLSWGPVSGALSCRPLLFQRDRLIFRWTYLWNEPIMTHDGQGKRNLSSLCSPAVWRCLANNWHLIERTVFSIAKIVSIAKQFSNAIQHCKDIQYYKEINGIVVLVGNKIWMVMWQIPHSEKHSQWWRNYQLWVLFFVGFLICCIFVSNNLKCSLNLRQTSCRMHSIPKSCGRMFASAVASSHPGVSDELLLLSRCPKLWARWLTSGFGANNWPLWLELDAFLINVRARIPSEFPSDSLRIPLRD